MQIAGLAQVTMGTIFQFTHLSSGQTAALSAYPTALGTFFAGMAINYRNGKNGKNGSPQSSS